MLYESVPTSNLAVTGYTVKASVNVNAAGISRTGRRLAFVDICKRSRKHCFRLSKKFLYLINSVVRLVMADM